MTTIYTKHLKDTRSCESTDRSRASLIQFINVIYILKGCDPLGLMTTTQVFEGAQRPKLSLAWTGITPALIIVLSIIANRKVINRKVG